MDVMDKVNLFLEELGKRDMSVQAGQTAIVCNDGVVILSTNEDNNVDIMVVNNRVDMDYTLGITNEDVDFFKAETALEEAFLGEAQTDGGDR